MAHPNTLDSTQTALVVVDVQERLMPAIHDGDRIIERCHRLIQGFRLLGLPILVTEQYPRGLGPTVAPLSEAAGEAPVFEKREFGACARPEFLQAIEPHSQLVLCGVETHVCVNQTAHGALAAGHQVHLATDAMGSRDPENHRVGLDKMSQGGAFPSSSEMALFELLHTSEHPEFKAISRLIR